MKKVLIAIISLVLLAGCLDQQKEKLRNQLVPETKAQRDSYASGDDQSQPPAPATNPSAPSNEVHYDPSTQVLDVTNPNGVQIVSASNVTDYKASQKFIAYQTTSGDLEVIDQNGNTVATASQVTQFDFDTSDGSDPHTLTYKTVDGQSHSINF